VKGVYVGATGIVKPVSIDSTNEVPQLGVRYRYIQRVKFGIRVFDQRVCWPVVKTLGTGHSVRVGNRLAGITSGELAEAAAHGKLKNGP
jgi:hypothetical protein